LSRVAKRLLRKNKPDDVHALRTLCRRQLARWPRPEDLADASSGRRRSLRRRRRQLKRLLAAAAPAREAQVLSHLAGLIWPRWSGLAELRKRFKASEHRSLESLAVLLRKMERRRRRAGSDRLDPCVACRSALPDPGWWSRLAAARRDRGAALHKLRLEVKALRYRMEAEPDVWPQGVAVLAALQGRLGHLHDLDELAAWRDRIVADGWPAPGGQAWQMRRRQAWQAFLEARREARKAWTERVEAQERGLAGSRDGDGGGRDEWLLVRHGPAGQALEPRGPEDRDRPLTAAGLQVCLRMAHGVVLRGWACQRVLASPLARTVQSAEAFCEVFGPHTELRFLEELEPGAGLDVAMAVLRNAATDGERILVVGHEPMLSQLAEALTGRSFTRRLRKGGLIRLKVPPSGPATLLDWLDP